MSEVIHGVPEGAQMWKSTVKMRPQTMADIEKSAQMHKEIIESLDRYWRREAEHEQLKQQAKIPWWLILIALLEGLGRSPEGNK